jgi:hypothetical protein
MNKEWARERLSKYISAVRVYKRYVDDQDFNQASYENVMKLELAAKAIMRQVNPDFVDYSFINHDHGKALTAAIQSLVLIDEAEEIEKNLAPVGPRLVADNFHTWVWDAARSLWATGHYRESVQAAATNINAHLQEIAGRRDISDYKLVIELFSDHDPEQGKPRLRWPGEPTDEAYKSMQAGLRSFGAAVFQGIRNQSTHDLKELQEYEALERLAAMSLLCRWIENCRVIKLE